MDELLSGGTEMLDDLGRSQGSVIDSNLVDLALEGCLPGISSAEIDGGEAPAVAGENDVFLSQHEALSWG